MCRLAAFAALLCACTTPMGMPRPVCVPPTAADTAPHASVGAAEAVAAAPLSDSPTADGYGALNEQIIHRIKGVNFIDHVKLGYTLGGTLREVSIYHTDPQPIGAKLKEVVHHEFPNSQLINYETEWENDVGAVTEATVKTSDGRICEVSMAASGDIRFMECIIEASELPKEVREAALQLLPGGQIVESVYREEQRGTLYEVELRVGTVVHVLRLRATGEVVDRMIQLKARLLLAE